MQLLNAEEVKKEKDKSEEEKKSRIAKLNEEETELVKKLNEKRAELESESARIDKEISEKKVWRDAQVSSLERDVRTLEERRRESLKPINDLKREVEKKLAEAEEDRKHASKDREESSKEWAKISARDSIMIEREKRVRKISDEFTVRENRITERESHFQSVREIQDKQVKYEMDKARKILEEAKALQIKNKTQ